MGRISKAIKLKLQELRIDDIFKDGILKYKELLSKNDEKNVELENNSEKNMPYNNDLDIENNFEDNEGIENNKEEKIEHYYESNSTENEEINIKAISKDNISIDEGINAEDKKAELNNSSADSVLEVKDINGISEKTATEGKLIRKEKLRPIKKSKQISKPVKMNETMMQYFEWYYPCDGSLWNKVKEKSKELSDVGITALWLPPACKAADGIYDAGYALYDLYDLGEFDQKGTVRTKYGTKDEYLKAIDEAHKNNIKIYGDVVFNHKGGADESEIVSARPVASNNRNEFIGEKRDIGAYTIFNFPGRGNKYSEYKWTANDFDGVDFDDITKEKGIFKFEGKEWEKDVDLENGNYDFLMFADLDMDSPCVVDELKRWGKWYLEQTNVDGFRLDAIKHIRFDFFEEWLNDVRKDSKKDLFAIGEYWTHDVNSLEILYG